MNKIWLWLIMMVMALPMQAQTDEDEYTDDDDTTAVASVWADTLQTANDSLPWPDNVRAEIRALLQHDMFQTSQVGMMVWDLDADSAIFCHNERQLLRPASTMKVITAITALDKLSGSYQFKTELCYTGQIDSCTLKGDVYCVGGFDPPSGLVPGPRST